MTIRFVIYLFSPICFCFLVLFVFLLRRDHAREIYGLWYIFSFVFLLFFGLHMLARRDHVELPEIFGPWGKDVFAAVYGWLTTVEDEFKLVIAILGLGIGPQLLTYILSSFSGSASPPRFVWLIENVAMWSLIKFWAALSGIFAASWVANWIVGEAFQERDFFLSIGGLYVTFLLAWVQLIVLTHPLYFGPWLRKFHSFATRYQKAEEE